ncbi:MAG: ABC transporter permease, partial [Acidobacteriaceae bacterium]|nr:ABC transporter permease [Acidobacteriaceae bacterium]
SALQALIPKDLVNSTSLSLDVPILLFAIVVSFVSGLLFGLLPALESSRLDLNQALKQGGRAATSGSHRLRNSFVVSQVALALVLVSGAGLLIETLTNLRTVDLGFPSDHLLTMRIPRAPDKLKSSAAVLSFTDRVLERVMQVPGVRSAGFASDLPFTSEGDTSGFRIQGRALSPEDQFNDALYREASNHYLQTLGARSISGRLLDERDTPQSPLAVVINETFARRYWPHESPLGAHLRFGGEKNPWRTIVGVIADVKERGLQRGMKPGVYLPFTQVDRPDASFLLVRTAGDPATLANSIRQAIWSIDPEQPVADIRTMEEYAELEMRTRAHQRNIFAVFAGLALFLAALGIYGVLAYAVAQRTREIGIRVALGADTLKIIRAIVGEGFALTSVGILVGTALAALSLHAMKSVLFGVKPTDPAAFSVGAAVLLGAALAACVVPAFTASRVDPVIALRNE